MKSSTARPEEERTRGGHEEDDKRQKDQGRETTQGQAVTGQDNSRTIASARRTRGGHRVGQRGQRTTAGQLQAPGGQEEDKDPDTEPGHRVQWRCQPVWPAVFSLRENPNSKLLGEKCSRENVPNNIPRAKDVPWNIHLEG